MACDKNQKLTMFKQKEVNEFVNQVKKKNDKLHSIDHITELHKVLLKGDPRKLAKVTMKIPREAFFLVTGH